MHGEMAERSNAAVLKTVDGQLSGGSNPSLSASYYRQIRFRDVSTRVNRIGGAVFFMWQSGKHYVLRYDECGGLVAALRRNSDCSPKAQSRQTVDGQLSRGSRERSDALRVCAKSLSLPKEKLTLGTVSIYFLLNCLGIQIML